MLRQDYKVICLWQDSEGPGKTDLNLFLAPILVGPKHSRGYHTFFAEKNVKTIWKLTQTRQTVMAHEAVDADAEQVWYPSKVSHRWSRIRPGTAGQPEAG
jgi:hypothetical protein